MKQSILDNLKQLKDILLSLIPKGKIELILFFFFLLLYVSYSLILVFNTSVIDHPYRFTDIYFSYDSTAIYHYGYTYWSGHPLLGWIMKPFIVVGGLLVNLLGIKSKTVLAVFLCASLISLSIVYVYRYMKEIINLKGYVLFLLTLFYGFFTTNMVLAFTTESFTISLFLLTFMVYSYSVHVAKQEKVTFLTNAFFAFGLGGVTTTNFVQGMIPILFTKEKLTLEITKILILCGLFFLLICQYFTSIGESVDTYTGNDCQGGIFRTIGSFFLGAPILASDITWTSAREMIDFTLYSSWWQYLFIIILFSLCLFSIIKNYRNNLIHILILLLGFNLVMHVFIGYGLFESFIYGGHWIYVVPLFLGWLYQSLNMNQQKAFLILLSALMLTLIINNIMQITSFIYMAMDKLPVVQFVE